MQRKLIWGTPEQFQYHKVEIWLTFRAYTLHFHQIHLHFSDEGYRPETSVIFLLCGTGIFLVLFYIYPIAPYAPAFLHRFPLLVTVVQGKDPKRHLNFYSVILDFSTMFWSIDGMVPYAQAFLHSSWYIIPCYLLSQYICNKYYQDRKTGDKQHYLLFH